MILASLSHNITFICDVIRRPGGFLNRGVSDRENKLSVLAAKNLNLTAFDFKIMEFMTFNI